MPRRFRKRRLPRQAILWIALIAITALTFRRPPGERTQWLPAGDYLVHQVYNGRELQLADLSNPGKSARVQLLGIQIPRELSAAQQREAVSFLKRLVARQRVTLRLDRRRIGEDDTLLGYIFVGELFVNAQLVRQGYAVAQPRSEDCPAMVRRLLGAQSHAKSSRCGIWQRRQAKPAGRDLHLKPAVS